MQSCVEFQEFVNKTGFRNAMQVWVQKPQVINRRLCGSKLLVRFTFKAEELRGRSIKQLAEHRLDLQDALASASCWNNENIRQKLLCECLANKNNECTDHESVTDEEQLPLQEHCDIEVIVRDLLPKQCDRYKSVREFIIIDQENGFAAFLPLWYTLPQSGGVEPADEVVWMVHYGQQQKLSVTLSEFVEKETAVLHSSKPEWITETLVPKLIQWSYEENLNVTPSSLSLVDVQQYNKLYNRLKDVYGKELVKVWPESTDPQKFVYEDIGIAAYLLLLWEEDRRKKGLKEKQTFVDLGCGNGLLVFLLSSEGHPGIGIDLQRRNIWNMYGTKVLLKEEAITPSASHLFPEYDWLIGNHSDELTPWIPVISARSSFHSNFFVLPCCAHDFDAKFTHKAKGTSQYQAYIQYIREVASVCGFNVEQDTLRIPSTKKVCLIGRSRSHKEEESAITEQQITEFIGKRCSLTIPKKLSKLSHSYTEAPSRAEDESDKVCKFYENTGESTWSDNSCNGKNNSAELSDNTETRNHAWALNFHARQSTQTLRNCVAIDFNLKQHILLTVFKYLLQDGAETRTDLQSSEKWNRGRTVELKEVVELFDKDTLKKLKNECGGLQTVLRNCSQAFLVKGGDVQIRDPTDATHKNPRNNQKKHKSKPSQSVGRHKVKLCFFHEHHPHGCPLPRETCQFAHGPEELRSAGHHIDTKRAKLSPDNLVQS